MDGRLCEVFIQGVRNRKINFGSYDANIIPCFSKRILKIKNYFSPNCLRTSGSYAY